ncbi:hypothetical protein AB0F13_00845 [Streptomyces sp. NPDC026206]|uniref:hypothetical protein n=1 Tax=Streptomyces sp. NPDC026206 TaxID=3157089 RepID=UPI0033BFF84C
MRRSISALALTAALAGGVVFTALPAQTASAATVTCNTGAMRHDIAALRQKAAKLKQLGEPEAARRANAQADALQHRLNQCIKADETASKPWG